MPPKLLSQLLREDASLRDLVGEFVRALPERLAELKQAYADLDWDLLATLAHRLKGAGAAYGYPDLSEVAARMEQAFRGREVGEFEGWTRQLEELVAAVQAGITEP